MTLKPFAFICLYLLLLLQDAPLLSSLCLFPSLSPIAHNTYFLNEAMIQKWFSTSSGSSSFCKVCIDYGVSNTLLSLQPRFILGFQPRKASRIMNNWLEIHSCIINHVQDWTPKCDIVFISIILYLGVRHHK